MVMFMGCAEREEVVMDLELATEQSMLVWQLTD